MGLNTMIIYIFKFVVGISQGLITSFRKAKNRSVSHGLKVVADALVKRRDSGEMMKIQDLQQGGKPHVILISY